MKAPNGLVLYFAILAFCTAANFLDGKPYGCWELCRQVCFDVDYAMDMD